MSEYSLPHPSETDRIISEYETHLESVEIGSPESFAFYDVVTEVNIIAQIAAQQDKLRHIIKSHLSPEEKEAQLAVLNSTINGHQVDRALLQLAIQERRLDPKTGKEYYQCNSEWFGRYISLVDSCGPNEDRLIAEQTAAEYLERLLHFYLKNQP